MTRPRAAAAAKRLLFCAEYVKDLDAGAAAARAGYAKGSARQTGAALKKLPDVKAELKRLTTKRLERAELSAERVLEELRRLSFADIRGLFAADGSLKPLHELTAEDAACIASVDIVMKNVTSGDGKIDRVLKVKTWDKTRSLEMLAKHFALLTEVIKHEGVVTLVDAVAAARARGAELRKAREKGGKP